MKIALSISHIRVRQSSVCLNQCLSWDMLLCPDEKLKMADPLDWQQPLQISFCLSGEEAGYKPEKDKLTSLMRKKDTIYIH